MANLSRRCDSARLLRQVVKIAATLPQMGNATFLAELISSGEMCGSRFLVPGSG